MPLKRWITITLELKGVIQFHRLHLTIPHVESFWICHFMIRQVGKSCQRQARNQIAFQPIQATKCTSGTDMETGVIDVESTTQTLALFLLCNTRPSLILRAKKKTASEATPSLGDLPLALSDARWARNFECHQCVLGCANESRTTREKWACPTQR